MALTLDNWRVILVGNNIIKPEEFTELTKKAPKNLDKLESHIKNKLKYTEAKFGELIAVYYNLSFVSLVDKIIPGDLLRIIPEQVARKKQAICFAKGKKSISLAMVNPDDVEFIADMKKKTGLNVKIHYTTVENINRAFVYYEKSIDVLIKEIIEDNTINNLNKIVMIIDKTIEFAYTSKSSDIHIEPWEKEVVVRTRIDGIMHDTVHLPIEFKDLLITRLKILSKLKTDEHRSPQDGRIKYVFEDNNFDIRLSIVPVIWGEKIVMRLLIDTGKALTLEKLGFSQKDNDIIIRSIKAPHGMILATGPTGSGKTTTLYSILKILNTTEVNITTIEDPVEYSIQRLNQIQVDRTSELTFAAGLRSILRQDPDIVMVGEIRDQETASIAINAALTGHLVLSTLHTNDAATTLPRLLDMDIEPFLVASTINVIIAQRLMRRVCLRCSINYRPLTSEELTYIQNNGRVKEIFEKLGHGNYKDIKVRHAPGCSYCSYTGYSGRVGIYEVLEMKDNIRKLVITQTDSKTISEQAQKNGMVTLLEEGLRKMIEGETTLEEVLRVAMD